MCVHRRHGAAVRSATAGVVAIGQEGGDVDGGVEATDAALLHLLQVRTCACVPCGCSCVRVCVTQACTHACLECAGMPMGAPMKSTGQALVQEECMVATEGTCFFLPGAAFSVKPGWQL